MKLYTINEWVEQLNEAFKAPLLSELQKVLKNTANEFKKTGNFDIKRIDKIWNAFPDIYNQRPSEILPEQVQKFTGKEAKKKMKEMPDSLFFFVYSGVLQSILKNNKNVSLSGWKYDIESWGYDAYSTDKDSKNAQQKNLRGKGYGHEGGRGKDDKTGASSLSSDDLQSTRYGTRYNYSKIKILNKSELFSNDVTVYAIESPSDAEKSITSELKKERIELFGNGIQNNAQFRKANQSRYKEILRKRKEEKRKGNVMPTDLVDKITSIKPRFEKLMNDVFQNPIKYRYKFLDKTVSFGSGIHRKTYTTSLLTLYTAIHESWAKLEKMFYLGQEINDTHEMRQFDEKYEDIDKILRKNNF